MSTVNPVQTNTYNLTAANNPITFGSATGINVSSRSGIGVYGSSAQSWSVTNQGAISGHLLGVDLVAGGSVTNKAEAAISGGYSSSVIFDGHKIAVARGGGVAISGGAGTVTNAGKISGAGFGVSLDAGGSVTNEAGATISATFLGTGITVVGGAGTVINAGSITGPLCGVHLLSGGSVTNEADGTISRVEISGGAVTNQAGATIGFVGMYGGAGTVTNRAGATISYGVVSNATATLTNAGKIGQTNNGFAVDLFRGGSVTNQAGRVISGGGEIGVYVGFYGANATVTNAGTISGTTASVEFAASGANTLTLETGSKLLGDAFGSTASGATNALVLEGEGTANNDFDNFDTLTVQTNADWTLDGDSTFAGTTVSSGKLVVAGTLDLHGAVTGTGTESISGASTLEFGSTVASGQTAGFSGGGALDLIDPLGFAGKIADFAATDTIDLSGDWNYLHFIENSGGTLGTLTLTNGTTDVALTFAGDFTPSDFIITPGTTTTTIAHS